MSNDCKYNPGEKSGCLVYIAIYLLVGITLETCNLKHEIAGIEQQLEQIQRRQIAVE